MLVPARISLISLPSLERDDNNTLRCRAGKFFFELASLPDGTRLLTVPISYSGERI